MSTSGTYHQRVFDSPVKLISAGKMNLTVVLEDNSIYMWGVGRKGSHFEGDSKSTDGWVKVKVDESDFDKSQDSIVDISSGTHFTLFVTASGKLFASGKDFFDVLGF